MRICFTCAFHPSIGGIETVADLVARELVAAGHQIEIVASNAGPATAPFPFPVHYRPSPRARLDLFRRADCILQFNLGLWSLWPNLFVGRPVVVVQQGIYDPTDISTRFSDRLKRRISAAYPMIAASAAVARVQVGRSVVVPNCYDPEIFFPGSASPTRDIVCVARLIRDKGVDLLIDAVARLRTTGVTPSVTIVGEGPERTALAAAVEAAGLRDQVLFTGAKSRREVADELRRHRVAVVPSRYQEAFGIVAVEAMACGCRVVTSDRGGLPEAVGAYGRSFDPTVSGSLAAVLTDLMHEPGKAPKDHAAEYAQHLRHFTPAVVAAGYLAVIDQAVAGVAPRVGSTTP